MNPIFTQSQAVRTRLQAVSQATFRPPTVLIQYTRAATTAAIARTIHVIGDARRAELSAHCAIVWARVTTFHIP